MEDDLVDQLRRLGCGVIGTISSHHCPTINAAADEIERLRTEVEWKTEYVVRYRLLYAQVFAATLQRNTFDSLYSDVADALEEHCESSFADPAPAR